MLPKQCSGELDNSSKLKKNLEERIKLAVQMVPRYTRESLLWVCSIYFSYPTLYKQIRKSSCVLLNLPDYLRKLSQALHYEKFSFEVFNLEVQNASGSRES